MVKTKPARVIVLARNKASGSRPAEEMEETTGHSVVFQ
jgi:hypothetical protein